MFVQLGHTAHSAREARRAPAAIGPTDTKGVGTVHTVIPRPVSNVLAAFATVDSDSIRAAGIAIEAIRKAGDVVAVFIHGYQRSISEVAVEVDLHIVVAAAEGVRGCSNLSPSLVIATRAYGCFAWVNNHVDCGTCGFWQPPLGPSLRGADGDVVRAWRQDQVEAAGERLGPPNAGPDRTTRTSLSTR